jgi:hypothetical protein
MYMALKTPIRSANAPENPIKSELGLIRDSLGYKNRVRQTI